MRHAIKEIWLLITLTIIFRVDDPDLPRKYSKLLNVPRCIPKSIYTYVSIKDQFPPKRICKINFPQVFYRVSIPVQCAQKPNGVIPTRLTNPNIDFARDVYVLEFAGRKWRRGASMKESQLFFASASLGSTKIYVVGGHDDQKNALCSTEMYDVEKDEWSIIPPMSEGRRTI